MQPTTQTKHGNNRHHYLFPFRSGYTFFQEYNQGRNELLYKLLCYFIQSTTQTNLINKSTINNYFIFTMDVHSSKNVARELIQYCTPYCAATCNK